MNIKSNNLIIIVLYITMNEVCLSKNINLSRKFAKCWWHNWGKEFLTCKLSSINTATMSSQVECASYCVSSSSGQEITFDNNFPLVGENPACMGFNYQPSTRMCQLFDQPCPRSDLNAVTGQPTGVYYQIVRQLGTMCNYGDSSDCNDILSTIPKDGVYLIKVDNQTYPVYCLISENETKYTVIQRRVDGSVNFYRGWTDYEIGFGNTSGEYWLGNSLISRITNSKSYKLRIELEAYNGSSAYAEYENFTVGPRNTNFKLIVSGYTGTAGDSMSFQNGMPFTTYDVDNDLRSPENCAVEYKGAWWYHDCYLSNLNGYYYHYQHSSDDGVVYQTFRSTAESLKVTKMLITRK